MQAPDQGTLGGNVKNEYSHAVLQCHLNDSSEPYILDVTGLQPIGSYHAELPIVHQQVERNGYKYPRILQSCINVLDVTFDNFTRKGQFLGDILSVNGHSEFVDAKEALVQEVRTRVDVFFNGLYEDGELERNGYNGSSVVAGQHAEVIQHVRMPKSFSMYAWREATRAHYRADTWVCHRVGLRWI